MPHRTQLSRADLLACLQVYGAGQLEAFAAALGYARRPPDQMTQPAAAPESRVRRPAPVTAPSLGPVPRACFYRVVTQRQLEPAERVLDVPAWFQTAQPFHEELRAAAGLYPPPQPPLMPWSRLWPFCRTALGAQVTTSRLDLPRIVERLARGQTFRHLPRQVRQGWATACQLLVDYAAPLLPFRTDFNAVHERLARLHGEPGLTRFALLDGDPEGRWAMHTSRTPQGWEEIDHYPLPAPDTPVLVLSDLGCIDKTDVRRHQWRRLGVRLRRAGCHPVALMPCPPRWWDAELAHLFMPVCWDRAVQPPRRPGARQVWGNVGAAVERDADAEWLLSLLGAAIRVEPALLRAVRYLLPAHEADVGSEAAAWNHTRVHATPLAFYYDQAAILHYRQAFTHQNLFLRQQVAELITAYHAYLSPSIGYEEQWLLADSAGVPEADQAQRFLERLVKTLHTQDGAFVESARAWVHRMTRRQHPPVWRNEALAAAWATVYLPQLQAGEPVTPPDGLDQARVSWLLEPEPVPRQYTLRQRGPMLYVEAEDLSPSTGGLETLGSPLSPISATTRSVQVQQGDARDVWQPLEQGIPLAAGGVVRLRTDQEELTIDSIARPEWAESIGRDAQGLCVTWAQGQRRAYWVPPGQYPVRNRAGERLSVLSLARGHWSDAAAGLSHLREGLQQPSWATDCGVDAYGLYAGFSVQGVSQHLRWIAPGEFLMGSPESEPERWKDETQHLVILSQGFWLAETTCTQALWQALMGRNPSQFQGPDLPVEQVSWDDVQRFLSRLNAVMPDGGWRLPTEAEWEYACRAGTTTAFWFGDQITPEQVNYDGRYPYAGGQTGMYRERTVPVRELPCNSWGLYQMHGNVWEWCQDWYGLYPTETVIDPGGPAGGALRVLRGGSWLGDGRGARSARRYADVPRLRYAYVGVRLARGQAIAGAAPEGQTARPASRARQPQRSGGGQARAGSAAEERHTMKYRFFSIPAMIPDDAQEAVNRFCAAHRVVSVEKQFVQDAERSYWALCICYLEPESGPVSPRKGKIDYREVLNESDFALFARLRTLRKTLAEQEGVPAYALFTNEQLAAMVHKRVTSKAALAAIDGVGTARIDKYGEAFLTVLRQQASANGKNATQHTDEAAQP